MLTRLPRSARFIPAVVLPIVFAAALPVADGMSYEFIMKSQSAQTGNKETVTLRGRGTYSGDDARIEILDASASTGGSETFGGKGTYFILRNGGQEMLLVDPNQKAYMKWDIANMFAGMGKVVNAVGGLVKLQMSEIKIDAQNLGAGETMQGHSTTHIRMTQNYTISAKAFGRTSKSRSETTTDYYYAPSLKIANPFVSNSQAMAMMSQLDMFNNPDYKGQMTAANAKLPRTGVPVKTVTRTVTTDEKGKQEVNVTTMEMVNFKATNVPASTYAIPSGYQMIEMPKLDANMAAGTGGPKGEKGSFADSLDGAAKDGAKEGLTEGVKETAKGAAKDAATKKLKGIFKR